MAKKSTCDDCGTEITLRDMNDGHFDEIVNYHPASMHLSTIHIKFIRDTSLRCNFPDLCKKCMIKHLLISLKESK